MLIVMMLWFIVPLLFYRNYGSFPAHCGADSGVRLRVELHKIASYDDSPYAPVKVVSICRRLGVKRDPVAHNVVDHSRSVSPCSQH
jgi:hypothetical protein